jgi:hypothetical protein
MDGSWDRRRLCVGRVVVLRGVLVLFGCLVLRLLACTVMLSGA